MARRRWPGPEVVWAGPCPPEADHAPLRSSVHLRPDPLPQLSTGWSPPLTRRGLFSTGSYPQAVDDFPQVWTVTALPRGPRAGTLTLATRLPRRIRLVRSMAPHC